MRLENAGRKSLRMRLESTWERGQEEPGNEVRVCLGMRLETARNEAMETVPLFFSSSSTSSGLEGVACREWM